MTLRSKVSIFRGSLLYSTLTTRVRVSGVSSMTVSKIPSLLHCCRRSVTDVKVLANCQRTACQITRIHNLEVTCILCTVELILYLGVIAHLRGVVLMVLLLQVH